jgi:hypothetical protein
MNNDPRDREPGSYGEGYVDGQIRETQEENAATGSLLLVLLAALLVGGGALAYWLATGQTREPVQQIIVPPSPAASPQPSQTVIVQPTKETTVIERTIEKEVAPSPSAAPPQVNIQVPPSAVSPSPTASVAPEASPSSVVSPSP